jgi:hypothetical protein
MSLLLRRIGFGWRQVRCRLNLGGCVHSPTQQRGNSSVDGLNLGNKHVYLSPTVSAQLFSCFHDLFDLLSVCVSQLVSWQTRVLRPMVCTSAACAFSCILSATVRMIFCIVCLMLCFIELIHYVAICQYMCLSSAINLNLAIVYITPIRTPSSHHILIL